jgi:DNA-binding HxlR family transcriptional regulator
MEIKKMACRAAEGCAEDQLEAEILSALLCGDADSSLLAQKLEVAEAVVADRLRQLKDRGAVHIADQKWSI